MASSPCTSTSVESSAALGAAAATKQLGTGGGRGAYAHMWVVRVGWSGCVWEHAHLFGRFRRAFRAGAACQMCSWTVRVVRSRAVRCTGHGNSAAKQAPPLPATRVRRGPEQLPGARG
eukprot:1265454-Prymnesium_polylepis.2